MIGTVRKVQTVDAFARVFFVGDRVVLTVAALRRMGIQRVSHVARAWTVRECACDLCRRGRHVCTDQPCANDNGCRHIACSSLRHYGQPEPGELPTPVSNQSSVATISARVSSRLADGNR